MLFYVPLIVFFFFFRKFWVFDLHTKPPPKSQLNGHKSLQLSLPVSFVLVRGVVRCGAVWSGVEGASRVRGVVWEGASKCLINLIGFLFENGKHHHPKEGGGASSTSPKEDGEKGPTTTKTKR